MRELKLVSIVFGMLIALSFTLTTLHGSKIPMPVKGPITSEQGGIVTGKEIQPTGEARVASLNKMHKSIKVIEINELIVEDVTFHEVVYSFEGGDASAHYFKPTAINSQIMGLILSMPEGDLRFLLN